MSGSTWCPCIFGQTWPELFAQLPDDQTRHRVSEVLADSHLEGKVHTREDVSDLIDVELGRITARRKASSAACSDSARIDPRRYEQARQQGSSVSSIFWKASAGAGRMTEVFSLEKPRITVAAMERKIQGEDISEAQIEEWVSEAEDGYDPDWLKSRCMGRPDDSQ